MFLQKRSKEDNVDQIRELFERLPRLRVGTQYTEDDRARDFIGVFGTEQGQRVLAQVADFCNPHPTPLDADKPGRLAFKEGQRFVLGQLMRCFLTGRRVPEHEEKPNVD